MASKFSKATGPQRTDVNQGKSVNRKKGSKSSIPAGQSHVGPEHAPSPKPKTAGGTTPAIGAGSNLDVVGVVGAPTGPVNVGTAEDGITRVGGQPIKGPKAS